MATLDRKAVLKDVDKLIKTVGDPRLVAEPVQHAIARLVVIGERGAKERAPDSVARSLHTEIQATQGKVISTDPAARFIEGGRKPGLPLPPTGPIADWMARKGLTGSPFVIARAIARRGIKGRFFMRRARLRVRQAMPEQMQRVAGEIASSWQKGQS